MHHHYYQLGRQIEKRTTTAFLKLAHTSAHLITAKLRRHWFGLISGFTCLTTFAYTPIALAQNPFVCDNNIYVSRSLQVDGATELNILDTNQGTFVLEPITAIGSDPDIKYNAIAFNLQDGFIYGINPDTEVVYRIGRDSPPVPLGVPANFPNLPLGATFFAGDIDREGNYFINSAQTNEILRINVLGNTATVVEIIPLSQQVDVADFAFNPLDNQLYGFDVIGGTAVAIDPTTGQVRALPPPTVVPDGVIGGTFFNGFGEFFAYQTRQEGLPVSFFQVDVGTISAPGTGEFTEVNLTQPASRNDGASCSFAPRIAKDVEPRIVVAGEIVTYTYRIANRSPFSFPNLTFTDILPDARTFVDGTLSDSLGGTPNNYGGTQTLEITGVTLPANTETTISVQVQVPPNAPVGTVNNQAVISGIPDGFGGPELSSDFIPIVGFPNPTPLEITENPLIGVAKDLTSLENLENGNFQITYSIVVENFGNVPLNNLQVTENFAENFGGIPLTVNSLSSTSGNLTANGNFDGINNTNLLSGADTLAVGQAETIELVVTVTPGANLEPLTNQVIGTAQSPSGIPTTDLSTNSTNPDNDGGDSNNDNDGNPNNNSELTLLDFSAPPVLAGPNLRLVKRITNVTRNGIPISNVDFSSFVDDPNDANDNAPSWSQLPNGRITGIPELGSDLLLQSGDEIEYTVYFVSDGKQPTTGILLCDLIPLGTTFISGSIFLDLPDQLKDVTPIFISKLDVSNPLFSVPPCSDPKNLNGAVVVKLGDIPNQAPNNLGFVRFRVRID